MQTLEIPIAQVAFSVPPEEDNDEFKGDVERIKNSIAETGILLHPITVRPQKDGCYPLASGRKRILAMKALGCQTIDAIVREVPEGENEDIIHIHENLMRSNLPWFEQVVLEKKLHELRINTFGQQERGRPKNNEVKGWSLRSTAQELDMSFGLLSTDIKLADAVLANPQLKKIANKETAKRVILSSIKQLNQESVAGLDVDMEVNQIYCGSSEVILQGFPANSFQACITDPPWMRFKDDQYTSDEFTLDVFKEIYRVMTLDSFLYAFVGIDDWFLYKKELPKFGFKVQQTPNIWIKEGSLTRGKRSWEYERNYELLVIAVKGAPSLTSTMLSAISSCKIVPPQKMIHPNEKPPEVIKKIIGDCTYEGALILDPFAGSGVVCEVARSMKRRFVGIERSRDHYSKIMKRLCLEEKK